MAVKSLWGDLSDLEILRTPKMILQKQADTLTEATKGVLVGVIDSRISRGRFSHDLNVVVPTMNNYTYTILTVSHGIDLYPVFIHSEVFGDGIPLPNESSLIDVLEKLLSSKKVKQILSSLLSQAS